MAALKSVAHYSSLALARLASSGGLRNATTLDAHRNAATTRRLTAGEPYHYVEALRLTSTVKKSAAASTLQ